MSVGILKLSMLRISRTVPSHFRVNAFKSSRLVLKFLSVANVPNDLLHMQKRKAFKLVKITQLRVSRFEDS